MLLLAASAAWADVPSFDRYSVIIERKPFGSLPAPEVKLPEQAPEHSFAENLRLTMIITPDEGPQKIGFIDGRTNKSYTMAEGESQDGIEMVSADFVNEQAILRQGSEMALIKFSTGAGQAINPGQVPTPTAAPQPPPQRNDYAARRQMRRQQEQPQPPPEPIVPKYTGAELEKHLSDYQMEVIRQGLPPLPIPLTPEQDAQLVKEGVLPPMQ